MYCVGLSYWIWGECWYVICIYVCFSETRHWGQGRKREREAPPYPGCKTRLLGRLSFFPGWPLGIPSPSQWFEIFLFFLYWVANTQLNYWTKRMVRIRSITYDPRNTSRTVADLISCRPTVQSGKNCSLAQCLWAGTHPRARNYRYTTWDFKQDFIKFSSIAFIFKSNRALNRFKVPVPLSFECS